jgi:hypothetical protein
MNVRDWSCKECGSGKLEQIGKLQIAEGETENIYCFNCKKRTAFEHRIRETDDDDIEENTAFKCGWCKRVLPGEELEIKSLETISDGICQDCWNHTPKYPSHLADIEGQN